MLTFTNTAVPFAARQPRAPFGMAPSMNREAMLEHEMPEDITGQEIKQLLCDLMEMSGQQAGARPALELLIGDILTRTSVEPEGQDLYLCVTGLLPPGKGQPSPAALMTSTLGQNEGFELLWHADHGRYIVMRKIALTRLSDERSVMDEILDTADLAQRCADKIGAK
jgi:hypothetical protein